MLSSYFYHQLTRKYVILFGNMFNNITVKRTHKETGAEIERIRVPIIYGPKEKYFTRLRSDPDLIKQYQISLPRMSFILKDMQYDNARKQNSLLKISKGDTTVYSKAQYMGVPYDLTFELQIYARNVDDGTHIIEQILPYFNPDYTVTIDSVPQIGFLKDIPIILESISNDVEYEGNYDSVRYVFWTLTFKIKAYYYGPIIQPKIIRTVLANIWSDPRPPGSSVKLNITNANGTFQLGDVVYQGDNYYTSHAYGTVSRWLANNNTLTLTNVQGSFTVNNYVRAYSTNGVCQIASFNPEAVKMAEIKVEPNPLNAMANSDFGYTTTITEWPQTQSNFQPSADSDIFTADNNNLTVDTE